jgi:hypothetical protein
MTAPDKEAIIRMAREAGFYGQYPEAYNIVMIERFAALVAAAEREACAKVAKEHAAEYKVGGRLYTMLGMNTSKPAEAACDHIAHLISERGQA